MKSSGTPSPLPYTQDEWSAATGEEEGRGSALAGVPCQKNRVNLAQIMVLKRDPWVQCRGKYLALGMASEALRTLSPITGSDSRSCNPHTAQSAERSRLDEGRATESC